MNIITYQDAYYSMLMEVWNDSLPFDVVDETNLGRRILWDQNFDPNHLFLAVEGDKAVGFAYAVVRRVPDEIAGLEAEKGYLVAMGVRKQDRRKGIGKALTTHVENALSAAHVKKIVVGAYATNYICPGVDKDNYPEGVAFLLSIGYRSTGSSVAMDIDLHTYTYPALYHEKKQALSMQGYRFKVFEPSDTVATYAFLRRDFPHWLPAVRSAMQAMIPGGLMIAYAPSNAVVGFVMRAMDGTIERFGPFGVSPDQQGKSIGSILFHDLMVSMQKARIFHTYFLWTAGRNLDFYGHWGMKVVRNYEMMHKELDDK